MVGVDSKGVERMEIKSACRIGELPSFWERRVVFVANLLSLFFGNEDETEELRRKVGTLETYGGRLLPILNLLFREQPNILILDRAPDPDMVTLFRDRLNLSLPEVATLDHEAYCTFATETPSPVAMALAETLARHEAEWVDGFVTDEPLTGLAELCGKATICSAEASWRGNNKVLLHRYLVERGLHTFDSVLLDHAEGLDRGLATLRGMGYRHAVVKSQIGASGIGLLKLDLASPRPVPEHMFFEGPCLLQGWLDDRVQGVERVASPSVQLFLDDEGLVLYDLTDQILGEQSVHEGNIAPPPFMVGETTLQSELLSQADVVGRWLHDQGYRGTASVDFLVIRRNRVFEAMVCEINARVTGATYPALLARHLVPGCTWLMRNLRFSKPLGGRALLDALDEGRLLLSAGDSEGVCPINLNLNDEGHVVKGQFLCVADSVEKTGELLDAIRSRAPVKADYDRD